MSKTDKGLIEHCKAAVKNKVQYVYGAKMQVLSLAQIKALQKQYGKTCVWDSDLSKAGKLCCDCSGLVSSYTDIVRNSSGYLATAVEYATIEQLKADWDKYVGWGLWLNGHIGVVSDTRGYYYAMDGSSRNMAHNPLNMQNWKKVIKLKDIEYVGVKKVVKNYDEAIKKLVECGVVSTREYWDNAVKCVKYLDTLIINMANKL